MKKIVALVDLSDVTPKILQQAQLLAQAFRSQVVILHGLPKQPVVVDIGLASPTVYRDPKPESIQADLEKLQQLSAPLAASGIDVSVQQLSDTSVDKILEETRRMEADLIIVGSHHHSA